MVEFMGSQNLGGDVKIKRIGNVYHLFDIN